MRAASTSPTILQMRSITKEFPGVKALADVSLTVRAAEIHAIWGENGARESALMKVLWGVHPYGVHAGEIIFPGTDAGRFGVINWDSANNEALELMARVGLSDDPTTAVKQHLLDLSAGLRAKGIACIMRRSP